MNAQTLTWRTMPADYKVLTVRRLAAEGLTSAAIANRLSKTYGKVTRNAVIGLCRRQGIQLGSSNGRKPVRKAKRPASDHQQQQNSAPEGKVITFPPTVTPGGEARTPEPSPPRVPDPVPASSHEPGPEGISILKLTKETCKQPLWGYGDRPVDGGRYCGCQVVSGAYCGRHASRNYVPYEQRKKGVRK